MSTPLRTVSIDALVFEALMEMMQTDIRHLAVADGTGRVVGFLTHQDIIAAQGQTPMFMLREIVEAEGMDEISVRRTGRCPAWAGRPLPAG
jgi:CBS domain-containing protein